jgi:hypothetical protein
VEDRSYISSTGRLDLFHVALHPNLNIFQAQRPVLESYKLACIIAKSMKPLTIGETLIKPCILEMGELMWGRQHQKGIENMSLSNDVIHSRVEDIFGYYIQYVMEELKVIPLPFS